MKTVSVIIPSFNAKELLKKNIGSVLEALRDGDEVIVVDDAGTDGSAEWLITEFKLKKTFEYLYQVPKNYFTKIVDSDIELYQEKIENSKKSFTFKLLILKKNNRFAGAVNIAALFASNPLLFLCNNDVTPDKNCFKFLRPYFDDIQVFAVGCLEYENSDQGQKSGKNKLWFHRGLFQHSRAHSFESGETAWASGGSAMFDKEKWMTLGGFDKAYYPAYWEDIDLSVRAKANGWKVLFEEQAVVYHKHESTHENVFGQSKIANISWKNSFTFAWKNGNLLQRCLFLVWLPYWLYIKHEESDR